MTPEQVREAAAKIAETFPDLDFGNWKGRPPKEDIAAAIRALPLPSDPRDAQLKIPPTEAAFSTSPKRARRSRSPGS